MSQLPAGIAKRWPRNISAEHKRGVLKRKRRSSDPLAASVESAGAAPALTIETYPLPGAESTVLVSFIHDISTTSPPPLDPSTAMVQQPSQNPEQYPVKTIYIPPTILKPTDFRPYEPYKAQDGRRILTYIRSVLSDAGMTLEQCEDEVLFKMIIPQRLIFCLAASVCDKPWEMPTCTTGKEINTMLRRFEQMIKDLEYKHAMNKDDAAANFARALKIYPIIPGGKTMFVDEARDYMLAITNVLEEAQLVDALNVEFVNYKGNDVSLGLQVFNLVMKQLPVVFRTWIKTCMSEESRQQDRNIKEFRHPNIVLGYLRNPRIETIPTPTLSLRSVVQTECYTGERHRHKRRKRRRGHKSRRHDMAVSAPRLPIA